MTKPLPPPHLVAAVAVGGALGAVARWGLSEMFPADPDEFPLTTFAINVTGSFILALLPAIAVIHRSAILTAGVGTGVLGGFTTLSSYSEETRALFDAGRPGVAVAYSLGTLAACLLAVALASHWAARAET